MKKKQDNFEGYLSLCPDTFKNTYAPAIIGFILSKLNKAYTACFENEIMWNDTHFEVSRDCSEKNGTGETKVKNFNQKFYSVKSSPILP